METHNQGIEKTRVTRRSHITIKPKALAVFAIIILAIIAYYVNSGGWNIPSVTNTSGTKDNYYAVFLTNNQVYFGHLENQENQYVELSNIYYLQVAGQNLQQKTDETDKTKLELVKLGNELHGPEDQMSVNRDQILFIEKLKADSQVVKTINGNQTNINASQ